MVFQETITEELQQAIDKLKADCRKAGVGVHEKFIVNKEGLNDGVIDLLRQNNIPEANALWVRTHCWTNSVVGTPILIKKDGTIMVKSSGKIHEYNKEFIDLTLKDAVIRSYREFMRLESLMDTPSKPEDVAKMVSWYNEVIERLK